MSRYIDGEKMLDELCADCKSKPSNPCPNLTGRCYEWELITRQPTADVREVKRGTWIDIDTVDGGYQTCSCCKQDIEPNLDGVFFYYPFCPWCGAEMEVQE